MARPRRRWRRRRQRCTQRNHRANAQYAWYPINFYDPREGFPRDFTALASFNPPLTAGTQGYANGIMNAVELDVGNLKEWLNGTIAGSGTQVEYTSQNGYLLYFSDRRGERPIRTMYPGILTSGKYGFEDTINSGSATGTPDTVLEASLVLRLFSRGCGPEHFPRQLGRSQRRSTDSTKTPPEILIRLWIA